MVEIVRVVRARTREEIEEQAWTTRAQLGLAPRERVPVARILENVLPDLIPDYDFTVAEEGELGAAEAVTDLNRPRITFSPKAYDGIYRDEPRYRMTGMHELGHLLMHTRQHVGLAFMRKYDALVDPERQADVFAAAILMPEFAFREVTSIEQAMELFGVSRDAACRRARTLQMYRELVVEPNHRGAKRKGRKQKPRTP